MNIFLTHFWTVKLFIHKPKPRPKSLKALAMLGRPEGARASRGVDKYYFSVIILVYYIFFETFFTIDHISQIVIK